MSAARRDGRLPHIAVHDHEALDTEVLQRIVAERLGDVETFAAAITRRLETGEAAKPQ